MELNIKEVLEEAVKKAETLTNELEKESLRGIEEAKGFTPITGLMVRSATLLGFLRGALNVVEIAEKD